MASYKVAQDVEADDKLLGPFSFRQFIYLIVATMAGVLAWGLSQVFIALAIIPLPIILFFLAIALPLRKDQPMEVYLAAIVSFYIKPKRRLWEPDGVQSLVEITVPIEDEAQLTKDLSSDEAERRLEYLSVLADSQGWSVRNAAPPVYNTPLNRSVYHEAQIQQDTFDDNSSVSQSFDNMINHSDEARRATIIQNMHAPQPITQPVNPTTVASPAPAQPIAVAPIAQPATPPAAPSLSPAPADQGLSNNPTTADLTQPAVSFNPYPASMRQRVLPTSQDAPATTPAPNPAVDANQATTQPPADQPPAEDNSTSDMHLSPDIINLVYNEDLSVETIAREANRIKEKSQDSDEVVISLR